MYWKCLWPALPTFANGPESGSMYAILMVSSATPGPQTEAITATIAKTKHNLLNVIIVSFRLVVRIFVNN
jgi:hypothetical protein